MRRTEQLQGLRMLKMRDVLSGWEAGRLSQLEAPLDLVITMDDATSAIYSAVLIEEEGTQSSFSACPRRLPPTACRAASTAIAAAITSTPPRPAVSWPGAS